MSRSRLFQLCRHGKTLHLPELIEKFGAVAELLDLRFVCTECGAAMANVEPMMR